MHTKLTIPERLKDLRVSEKKMSLQELSDATGIPCSTLGNYERDENVDMSLSSLLTLADFIMSAPIIYFAVRNYGSIKINQYLICI